MKRIGHRSGSAPSPPGRRGMGIARTVVFGSVVVALFFGVFGVWAAFVPLESAAIAPGC